MAPTQKGIEFTEHAEAQMAARVISRDQVINAIRRPTSRGVGNADYTQRFEREFPPSRRLVVIAEELPDKFKVVTAYWQPLKK